MSKYIDGFVIAVPKKRINEYRRIARLAAKVWKEHGALEYRECVGDDMKVKCGIPFPKLANAKRTETVVFAWIAYRSRAHRDKVNAKVMKDPRMNTMIDPDNLPFDPQRMTYGGFNVMVDQ